MRAGLLLLVCLPAWARPGAGTLSDPILVDAFPYVAKGDTTSGSHAIALYSCGAQNESGGEVVYRFTLSAAARVTAWVEATAPVDVDVHLLTDATLSGTTASNCVARGDVIAEAQLDAGDHFIVVDSFTSDAHAGPYVLHLEAIGDAWISRTLADGVTWRSRRFAGVAGGPQVVNELVIDPQATGVHVKALAATGCQNVETVGQNAGAIAGTNGGYFDTAAANCAPVSLLKASGTLVGKNTSASMRGAFGISSSLQPLVALVGPNVDWPAAFEAHSGGPILAQAGAAHMGSASWSTEGFMSASFLGINPRTFTGFDAMMHVHIGTVDGRRVGASANGMGMDALAAFIAGSEIGVTDAVNLDGGGSSVMWVAGATPNGIVNYPSDGNTTENPTHPGSRGVSGGWFVFAPAYNHPPRFQTTPLSDATVGTPYAYDADAIDLDVADTLSFRLEAPPPGVTVDTDGTVKFLPAADDPPTYGIVLVVEDGHGGSARQSWTVTIAGATGAPEDAGPTVSPDDAAASGDTPDLATQHGANASSGCSISGRPTSPLCLLPLLLLFFLRRKHA